MQVAILGPLEVRDDSGALVPVTGARLRTLLVRLALDPGSPVSASALVDAVWADEPPADEANALQTLVSRLRRALGSARSVVQSPAGYQLAVDPQAVDATRFATLAADGARALRDGAPDRAAAVLRDALALWRGPALGDASDALTSAAIRLADLRLGAVVDRITADVELGEADSVVVELEALADDCPFDERIAKQLVIALARSGRQADALRAYEQVRERLADELGVDPSADLSAVHLAVLRGEFGAVDAPDERVRRTNLKAALTSFVGRDDELARVEKALDQNRLVTLVGPGGAGKTRLAGEAGARLDVRDGVWLAELAPVTDSGAVAQAVLGALGLREQSILERRRRTASDAEGRLLDVLADKSAVLVLDNCEHLIDASAVLAERLLEQCPRLRVLATSREPLGIIGEVVLAVPPLGQPRSDASAALALEYPAVRLFADRAAATLPDFGIDDGNVADVIEIVRRLDGLPLAIELAAARLRTLPLDEIAARLGDRFRLLTGGSRTAMPRHRTLRAVVEWSWELLSESEQRLVERLAVFPAGVVVDSARAICADDSVPSDDIPDLLTSLLDKSLLQRVGGGRRLRMLETIREFGIELLAERGQLADARRRHAEYFTRLVAECEPHLTMRDQLPYFDLLAAERDNVLAALRYCCDTGDADRALDIAIGYSGFAMLIGNHADVPVWISEALQVPGAAERNDRWLAAGLLAVNAAAGNTSTPIIEESLTSLETIARQLAEVQSARHAFFEVLAPAVALFAGDRDLAVRMLERGLVSASPWVRAATRMFRANLHENDGDIPAMSADVDLALAEFRELGERWGLANTLREKALILSLGGDLDGAQTCYEEALDLMAQMKSREDEAYLLVRLGELAIRRGDMPTARSMIERARVSAENSGSPLESVFTLGMLAEIERHAGDPGRARALHAEAQRRIAAMPPRHPAMGHAHAIVHAMGARLAFGDDDRAGARDMIALAWTAAVETTDLPITAAVGMVVAEMVALSDNPRRAAEMVGAAARLRGADDLTAPDIRELTEMLRAALGDQAFEAAYAAGKSLDRAAALQRLDPAEALD